MELRHLRYFIAVAEELSFSQAARRLNIAQPPLSQQIQDLERETGLKLFDRSRRKIMLTQSGKDFMVDARNVLDSVAQLERKTKLRSEGHLGRLSIGVNMAIISPHFFSSILRRFRQRHPEIDLSLSDYLSVRQLEGLLSGEIDAGFLRLPSQIPDLIDTHLIKRETMRMAVPTGHALARKKSVNWSELKGENFILINPDAARMFYEGLYFKCRMAGFEPKVEQYTNNLSTQLWMVSAGLGIAPLPTTPNILKRGGVTFVSLPADAPVYETVMAWRRGDLSPVLQRFVQFIRRGE